MTQRAAFLDRDGTIIEDVHFLTRPEDIRLLPGVASALKRLRDAGYLLIIVSNQSGIGRGYFGEEDAERANRRLVELLEAEGVRLDGIYCCPHMPDDDCECRKPNPALLLQAASELCFDPEDCFIIGDKACDIEMGSAVEATTILVRTGYGEEEIARKSVHPDFVACDLMEAAILIRMLLSIEYKIGKSSAAGVGEPVVETMETL